MRKTFLTTAFIAAILVFSACAEAPQNGLDSSPAPQLSETSPAPQVSGAATTPSHKTRVGEAKPSNLPERYQGLDPKEITRVEIDELIALQKEQKELAKAYRAEYNTWSEQDPAIRGDPPQRVLSPRAQEINARIRNLNGKVKLANIRKKYENIDPAVLSKAEAQELITLEQEQSKFFLEFRNRVNAWSEQDPSTRGPRPEIDQHRLIGDNPRLMELQNKVRNADEINHIKERVKKVSATYNVTLSDIEIGELTALETEGNKLEIEMTKVMMELEASMTEEDKNRLSDGDTEIVTKAFNSVPKHVFQRMLDIEQRKDAIKAPLDAAEKADKIRKDMARLSEESGVAILSGELEETITLKAEKDRIEKKTQYDAIHKWMNEGGSINFDQPLPNDEDYARIKEIDARLKAISAPMIDAKNAALEADNPALRTQRLYQETQQKWADKWQDRIQAGEIPQGTIMQSPSYAEVQDQVKDYSDKLKTRAETVGYSVPEADLKRLEALNEKMLTIRKKVDAMQMNGTSMIRDETGGVSPAFGLTSGMYKIGLIEKRRQEILADLSEVEAALSETRLTETSQNGVKETGTVPFDRRRFSENYNYLGIGVEGQEGAEALIESYRDRGINVSQSDANELLAFERDMEREE